MLLRKLIILSLILAGYFSAQGHSKTEIGFRFVEEDKKTYLEVHLTTLTLFDLLYDRYPYLRSHESLNLNEYVADYEIYFNENIELEINDRDQRLKYIDSNLIGHDATIKFLLPELNEEISEYQLSIGGFEFYKKPSYTVLITTASITQTHFLSKQENQCAWISPASKEQNSSIVLNLFDWKWQTAIMLCLLISVWYIRKTYIRTFGWQ